METLWEIVAGTIVQNSDVIVGGLIGLIGGWLGLSKPKDKAKIRTYEPVEKIYDSTKDILGRDRGGDS